MSLEHTTRRNPFANLPHICVERTHIEPPAAKERRPVSRDVIWRERERERERDKGCTFRRAVGDRGSRAAALRAERSVRRARAVRRLPSASPPRLSQPAWKTLADAPTYLLQLRGVAAAAGGAQGRSRLFPRCAERAAVLPRSDGDAASRACVRVRDVSQQGLATLWARACWRVRAQRLVSRV